jgi:hypothetical protein
MGQPQTASQQQQNSSTQQNAHHTGTGTRQPLSLNDLELHLKELSTRNWGELEGTLKTELQNTSRKRPEGDYARLIKLYFEDISRRQSPDVPASPQN